MQALAPVPLCGVLAFAPPLLLLGHRNSSHQKTQSILNRQPPLRALYVFSIILAFSFSLVLRLLSLLYFTICIYGNPSLSVS